MFPPGNNPHCSRPLIARGRKGRKGKREDGGKEGRKRSREKKDTRRQEKERVGSQLAGGVVIRDLAMGKCKLRLSKTKV